MKTVNDIQLEQKDRHSILEAARTLRSDLPVKRIILFGSKVRGTSEPDSDIDLLILTECQINSKLRRTISDRLADINLRNDVFLTSVVVPEQEWTNGLIRYSLLHSEVEKCGCEI